MFSSSRCILNNRKLLESISYKVQSVSLFHVCKSHQSLNERRLLNLLGNNRNLGVLLKPVYAARLISTKDVSSQISSETASNVPAASTQSVTDNVAQADGIGSSQNVENISDSILKTSVVADSATKQDVVRELPDVPIPEPPAPPKIVDGQIVDGNFLIDPPFEQLGLGGWTPVGWVQNAFEFLHVSGGLPWWECIILGTVVVRTTLFPLMVISQRNNARLQNNQPIFQELQLKANEARQRGDQLEAARYTQDLVLFMRKKGINPIKNMIIPLVQAPIFLSFFMGLREMANIPLKSMYNGGLFWFTDLTIPDQLYILPIITSFSLWCAIELGADSGKMTSQNQYLVKYILRAIPVVMLPFTINFPAAILLYWTGSNLISLGQVALFKVPRVRAYFNIEQLVKHNQDKLPVKPKGFIQAVKDWWKNTRTESAHTDRTRANQRSFSAAGRGAVPKTYKYDPTQPRPAETSSSAGIQAKKY